MRAGEVSESAGLWTGAWSTEMAERNWGQIASGATFEALATTLIFFEDAGAALFGRRGVDGGQDARSSDGTRVFQAKHHEKASASKAISDAKAEAAKIAKYQKPGHSRFKQWEKVTHWRLVTNATFNPTQRQSWDDEVVPRFDALGLTADYWEQATLDALLDKHPEVNRAFFGGASRVFLTVPEARESFAFKEPFLPRAAEAEFRGRQGELQKARDFVDSHKLFWVLHGAGGIGKTRLLLEAGARLAGEGQWQVLWANVASMEASSDWFSAVIPERKTLLLLDEPEDEGLLKVLVEQFGARFGRTAAWKIAVAVRSPKDPVLKFVRAPRLRAEVQEDAVSDFPQDQGSLLCADLLNGGSLGTRPRGWRDAAVAHLTRHFSSHPIWLTLAVSLLESRGDLTGMPESAGDLADQYLREMVYQRADGEAERVERLLRWVSLIGVVNREDEGTCTVLVEGTGIEGKSEVLGEIQHLVQRRILAERGARNRLVEFKPDVLRDHVLRAWLAIDTGLQRQARELSSAAKKLTTDLADAILRGGLSAVGQQILRSVVRTELLLRFAQTPVELTATIFDVANDRLAEVGAVGRQTLLQASVDLAFAQPLKAVQLCTRIRTEPVEPEVVQGLLGDHTVLQEDVLLDCAWVVFHAAMRATEEEEQEAALAELVELAEEESRIGGSRSRGLPNDGKRAADLLGRVLQGGPSFWGSYSEVGRKIALDSIKSLGPAEIDPARKQSLGILLDAMLAVERMQIWSEDHSIQMRNYIILPGSSEWTARAELRSQLREIVTNETTPPSTRRFIWRRLGDAHSSANRGLKVGKDEIAQALVADLKADLLWAKDVLQFRIGDLAELRAARRIWDWHFRFERDEELKAAATDLEALYQKNDAVAEFGMLSDRSRWKETKDWCADKASELAEADDLEVIKSFVSRASSYLDKDRLVSVLPVAGNLGELAPGHEPIRAFVEQELAQRGVERPGFQFAVVAVGAWVSKAREDEPDSASELAKRLADLCAGEVEKAAVYARIYDNFASAGPEELTAEEHHLVRAQGPMFVSAGWGPQFVHAVAWTFDFEWAGLKRAIDKVLEQLDPGAQATALQSLLDAVSSSLHRRKAADSQVALPADFFEWVLDHLARLPDIDTLGSHAAWELEELAKVAQRPSPGWLVEALDARAKMEQELGYDRAKAVGLGVRLSQLVSPLTSVEDNTQRAQIADRLIDFSSNQGTLGYRHPEICNDLDPNGEVLPGRLADRIAGAGDDEEVRRYARVAGMYQIGSDAWRQVAKPVIDRALTKSGRARYSLFSSLTDHRPQSWSGTVGEVPAIFVSELRTAEANRDAETDPALREFWDWQVKAAEYSLRDQEEQAKEDRGE